MSGTFKDVHVPPMLMAFGITTVDANQVISTEFKDVKIQIEVFVPLTQWYIKSTNLRPFAILGKVQESLDNKKSYAWVFPLQRQE